MDDLIAELKSHKSDATVKLVPTDDCAISMPKDVLCRCTFFQNLLSERPNNRQYSINVRKATLDTFCRYLEGKHVSLANAFDAILFGRQVGDNDFVRYCCEAADGVDAPADSTVDSVNFVIQALVKNLPLRTFEHYKELLDKMILHLPSEEKDIIIDGVIETISLRKDTIAPLPVSIFNRKATVALMKNTKGQDTMTLFENGAWLPFNMFGPNFCPFAEQVKQFHLAFGRYVVYEASDDRVLFKDLRSESQPAQILFSSCKFFRSRCNQLHVIRNDEASRRDCLYEWNSDLMKFEMRFSRKKSKLESAWRERCGALIIALESGVHIQISQGNVLEALDVIRLSNWKDKPAHAGYTELSVIDNDDNLYTTRYSHGCSSKETHVHGPVSILSDVLLL